MLNRVNKSGYEHTMLSFVINVFSNAQKVLLNEEIQNNVLIAAEGVKQWNQMANEKNGGIFSEPLS